MSEHIEMQAGDVKALLRIAPDSEVRYYLCGIFFDPKGYAVVTDGAALMAIRCAPFDGDGFIVRREVLEAACKASTGKNPPPIMISRTEVRYSLKGTWTVMSHTPVDGRYPEWRRVVPDRASGELAVYDSELLERLRKARDDMQDGDRAGRKAFVHMNGDGPGFLFTERTDVLAIIMPMRAKGTEVTAERIAAFKQSAAPAQSEAA
jgi:DNA polymerase sliding clamp subunit (PCNA homolog)